MDGSGVPEVQESMAGMLSVMGKIEWAIRVLSDQAVSNLILRENRKIECETTIKGEVTICPLEEPNVETQVLTRDEMKALFNLVAQDWQSRIRNGGIDGPIRMGESARYRANIFLWGGEQSDVADGLPGLLGCLIRVIPEKVPALWSLGLPGYMRVLAEANYGLLLVVGPTGSGKTTTMSSYIDHINQSRVGHIVTIEDPIEYMLDEDKCRITPREVGTNVSSIAVGVRDAMREIPLAIMVGEVRDTETLVETFRAARSGHYVVATKHAPNLVAAIRSIVDDLPGDSKANAAMIAETLLGVIFQVRVPSTDFGKWEFVHETMNVTGNQRVQEMILNQQWSDLRGYLENQGGQRNEGVEALNRNLAKNVVQGKITALAADRRAYDRVGLRVAIAAAKADAGRDTQPA